MLEIGAKIHWFKDTMDLRHMEASLEKVRGCPASKHNWQYIAAVCKNYEPDSPRMYKPAAAEPIDRDKYVYKPDFVQNPKKAEYEARFVKAAALRDQWSREGMNYDDAFDKACLECNVNRPGGRRRA